MENGLEQAMQFLKEALKKLGRRIMSAITPALPYIIVASLIVLVIVGCTEWDAERSNNIVY